MDIHQLTRQLFVETDSKIVLFVADGLGGLPQNPDGVTELESASTPNLDDLARRGVLGLSIPVAPGITPGSGPGHLALFGYDPIRYVIGRGALEATGIGFELQPGDVAARCNFCTIDKNGNIADRRAGRIASAQSAPLAHQLDNIQIEGVEVFVRPVKEHRFVVVFRGNGLHGDVSDTDPQRCGVPPLPAVATSPQSQRTADVANQFISRARPILARQPQANALTMRGFAERPVLPSFREVYGLRAAAIAVYPMYKGLARLVGMEIVGSPADLDQQLQLLESCWDRYDFFFLHFKYTDSTGEDGDFAGRIARIEEMDRQIPRIMQRKPDVLIVSGDHSTPAVLRSHSWHPVPTLLVSDCCRSDGCMRFSERDCIVGGLGQFEAKYLMTLALANAKKLTKFGA